MFDRLTGEPVWPIEERAVPQSTVPGEVLSATQPFPTKPAAFEPQGISDETLIDFSAELRNEALQNIEKYEKLTKFDDKRFTILKICVFSKSDLY